MVQIEVQPTTSEKPSLDETFEKAIIKRAIQHELKKDELYRIIYIPCTPSAQSDAMVIVYGQKKLNLILTDSDLLPHQEVACLIAIHDPQQPFDAVDVYLARGKTDDSPEQYAVDKIGELREKDTAIELTFFTKQPLPSHFLLRDQTEGTLIILTEQNGFDIRSIQLLEKQGEL